MDWKKQIFEQKNLWQVYKLSMRVLPKSVFNCWIFWGSAAIVTALSFTLVICVDFYEAENAISLALQLSDDAIGLSIGILGFLIAGFSIFASITRTDIFIALANIPYGDGRINRLQFVFFNFLNVFVVYFWLLVLAIAVQLFCSSDSPFLKGYLELERPGWLDLSIALLLVDLLLLALISAVLRFKSFLWSLYQTVLVSIATQAELNDRVRKE